MLDRELKYTENLFRRVPSLVCRSGMVKGNPERFLKKKGQITISECCRPENGRRPPNCCEYWLGNEGKIPKIGKCHRVCLVQSLEYDYITTLRE